MENKIVLVETKEVKEAYAKWLEAEKVEKETKTYDRRSKECRAKAKAEKEYVEIVKAEAKKQGKEIIKMLEFSEDLVHISTSCYHKTDYNVEDRSNPIILYFDSSKYKSGFFGTITELKKYLTEKQAEADERKADVIKTNEAIKKLRSELDNKGIEYNNSHYDNNYYSGLTIEKGGNCNDKNRLEMNIDYKPKIDSFSVKLDLGFAKVSRKMAIKMFEAVNKIYDEQVKKVKQ